MRAEIARIFSSRLAASAAAKGRIILADERTNESGGRALALNENELSVNGWLGELGGRAREELQTPVEVLDAKSFPAEGEIYTERRTWRRIRNVVVVAADLKNSTRLSFNRHPQTSARVYEAATGNCARIVGRFGPDFVDIQGDGLFALFHGERAHERALCAGISLKTFSERHLVPEIGRMPSAMQENVPETGIKVGMASGVLAVKKVGVRGGSEPVWAGRPVNWAAKCAQKADAHELIATEAVFRHFQNNDYVTHSCGCPSGHAKELWSGQVVEKLPEEHAQCKVLRSGWCAEHGDEFCRQILRGQSRRPEVSGPSLSRGA